MVDGKFNNQLLTRYIHSESIIPRKIRGLGADGLEGEALRIFEGVAQWRPIDALNSARARLYRSIDFPMPISASNQTIRWDRESYKVAPRNPSFDMHRSNDLGNNESAFIYLPVSGVYMVNGYFPFRPGGAPTAWYTGAKRVDLMWQKFDPATSTYSSSIQIDVDLREPVSTGIVTPVRISHVGIFNANDRIFVRAFQDSPHAGIITGGEPGTGGAIADRMSFTVARLSELS